VRNAFGKIFVLSGVARSKLFIVNLQSSDSIVMLLYFVLQSSHSFSLESFKLFEQLALRSEVMFALVLNSKNIYTDH
jgi:hypothetical protein